MIHRAQGNLSTRPSMKSTRVCGLGIVLGTIMLTASMCGAAAQEKSQQDSQDQPQGSAGPVWPTKEWLTSTPGEQGMDSADLAKLVAYGTSRSFDSLLLRVTAKSCWIRIMRRTALRSRASLIHPPRPSSPPWRRWL